MYTTDTDVLCCPHCGAQWFPTETWEHPQTLPERRGHWSVGLMVATLVLGGAANNLGCQSLIVGGPRAPSRPS